MTTLRQLTPIPFTSVHLEDAFWAPRMQVNRQVTLPHIYQKLTETGRISAFDLHFTRPVPSPIVQIFGDSDVAKWIEAASYALATQPDPQLETLLDGVVERVIHAQQPDGYLDTHFIVTQPEMRWKNLRDWHELYCAGHLMEGAVAHYQATGQRKLLDALCRYADHIDAQFGLQPGQKAGYPGHPEVELALVRLFQATGSQRYLDLARYFINERGQRTAEKPHYYDLEARARGEDPANFWAHTYDYCQAEQPIREQHKVVGHAVRAMYLFSAVADLADADDDVTLWQTCERLWDNLTTRRMYLTGGIGPSHSNEGFTTDYDLPDESAYAETCATIGLVQWNQRLLQFNGERRFADVMERGLYNGFLSGVSLDGARFLYENPLSSDGSRHHQDWFECPCCPPNVARMLASIGHFFYSTGPNAVWVHLFAQGSAEMTVGDMPLTLRQTTRYPWDGLVQITLSPSAPTPFTLHVRVPGWCSQFRVRINGQEHTQAPEENGYLAFQRTWHAGDVLEYEMAMPIQPVFAHPAVRALEGRVAIQRGPLVYCLEGVDHDQIILDRISVNAEDIPNFTLEERPDLLGGVVLIHGQGQVIGGDGWGDTLYRSIPPTQQSLPIIAVPYCVWDNRSSGEMRVWLRAHTDEPSS